MRARQVQSLQPRCVTAPNSRFGCTSFFAFAMSPLPRARPPSTTPPVERIGRPGHMTTAIYDPTQISVGARIVHFGAHHPRRSAHHPRSGAHDSRSGARHTFHGARHISPSARHTFYGARSPCHGARPCSRSARHTLRRASPLAAAQASHPTVARRFANRCARRAFASSANRLSSSVAASIPLTPTGFNASSTATNVTNAETQGQVSPSPHPPLRHHIELQRSPKRRRHPRRQPHHLPHLDRPLERQLVNPRRDHDPPRMPLRANRPTQIHPRHDLPPNTLPSALACVGSTNSVIVVIDADTGRGASDAGWLRAESDEGAGSLATPPDTTAARAASPPRADLAVRRLEEEA